MILWRGIAEADLKIEKDWRKTTRWRPPARFVGFGNVALLRATTTTLLSSLGKHLLASIRLRPNFFAGDFATILAIGLTYSNAVLRLLRVIRSPAGDKSFVVRWRIDPDAPLGDDPECDRQACFQDTELFKLLGRFEA